MGQLFSRNKRKANESKETYKELYPEMYERYEKKILSKLSCMYSGKFTKCSFTIEDKAKTYVTFYIIDELLEKYQSVFREKDMVLFWECVNLYDVGFWGGREIIARTYTINLTERKRTFLSALK